MVRSKVPTIFVVVVAVTVPYKSLYRERLRIIWGVITKPVPDREVMETVVFVCALLGVILDNVTAAVESLISKPLVSVADCPSGLVTITFQ